jgi:hypothetical protein
LQVPTLSTTKEPPGRHPRLPRLHRPHERAEQAAPAYTDIELAVLEAELFIEWSTDKFGIG